MASKKNEKPSSSFFRYPASLLIPVGNFLKGQLNELKRRRTEISKEDPFKNPERALDNAAMDADAEEQYGHERTSAINRELNRKIIQTKKALAMVRLGTYGVCESCNKMIDTDRLMVFPETTYCVECQKKRPSSQK